MKLRWLIVPAVLAWAGCELLPVHIPELLSSGIQGVVTAGPQCPVETVPPTPGCEDKPLAATIIVRAAATYLEVTRFTSAADGTFNASLAPGDYVLDPQTPGPGPFPRGEPQTVDVNAGEFTQVSIQYDTGIR